MTPVIASPPAVLFVQRLAGRKLTRLIHLAADDSHAAGKLHVKDLDSAEPNFQLGMSKKTKSLVSTGCRKISKVRNQFGVHPDYLDVKW